MKFTRREILTTFLGAPLALAACRSGAVQKFPEGRIVGANVSLGHILRENRTFEVPAGNWQNAKVGIVGAGVAGLSAAWQLKRKGVNDLVVLELEKEPGGTAQSGKGEPVGYPWAAHYLPVPFEENRNLREFLQEMQIMDSAGTVPEQYLCRDPEERVFYKGRWYDGLYLHVGESDEDKRQFAAFQHEIDTWVNWRDASGKRAFAVPLETCSNDPAVTDLDKISFAEWLTSKGLNSERLRWYCDYATRDDYGLKADQASAWVGLFYFCSRVLKSGVESQPFITFPEGNGRFVEHFLSKVGDNVKRSHMVVSVVPTEKGVDIVCLDGDTVRGYHCEKAVFASPMFTAPYIISGFREDQPFAAHEFQHNAWFVANLFLKDRPKSRFPRDFPLAWDNVLYESPSLGYVVATHQKGIDYGPTILTYYYPMCHEENSRTKLFNYEWRDLADVCLADIARAHPDVYELTERVDIMRWGHAMISPRPGFIWGGARRQAMKPYKNIHFAHTDLSGVALFEEAFYHGLRAAGEIAGK